MSVPDGPPFEAFLPLLPAHDLAATRDFYARELGLRPAREEPEELVLHAGRGLLGFRLHEGPLPRCDGLLLSFAAADVDGLYRRLRRLGVETEGAPRSSADGAYRFVARDPDGYRVEIRRGPADPVGA